MLKPCIQFVLASLCLLPLWSNAEQLDWPALTNIAWRYHLPLPPAEARLVLAHTGYREVLGQSSTSRDPGIYSPAFLLEENGGKATVLRGAARQTLDARMDCRPGESLWRQFSTAPVKPKLGGYAVSFDESSFVCAVQLAMLGEQTKAQQIWDSVVSSGSFDVHWGWNGSVAEQTKNPSRLFARCLFDHLRSQVLTDPTNWPEIRVKMEALLTEFPALKDAWRKQIWEGLAAAVDATPPTPDSVEALLLDWSRRPSNMRNWVHFVWDGPESDADTPARVIVLRGADAMPDLLKLIADRRITVHVDTSMAFSGARPRICTVGELAGYLLAEIAGIEASSDASVFRGWFENQQKTGEATALAGSVFVREKGRITRVNETPARIVALKYPDRLRDLCSEFLKNATSEAEPFSLAKAIVSARLPNEVRVQILSEFARQGSLEHKRCYLQNLAEIDDRASARILAPLLDEMPKDAKGPYWLCAEARFTHVLMQIEDDAIWRKYLQFAKRSSVGLRMELMNPMNYSYVQEKNRLRRLAFLASFLNDREVRNMRSDENKFDGPCAAFTIPKIAVRNFAAMEIAAILDLPDSPDEFWTAAQWKQLRKKVSDKLAAEKLPKLD